MCVHLHMISIPAAGVRPGSEKRARCSGSSSISPEGRRGTASMDTAFADVARSILCHFVRYWIGTYIIQYIALLLQCRIITAPMTGRAYVSLVNDMHILSFFREIFIIIIQVTVLLHCRLGRGSVA
jgi:hypothetical protein